MIAINEQQSACCIIVPIQRTMTQKKKMTKQNKSPVAEQTDVKPVFPLSRLHDDIEQLFRSFQSDFKIPEFFGDADKDFIRPNVDAYETANELQISVELPGVNEKDINVEAHNGTLIISSEKRTDSEVKDEDYYRKERTYGSFSRSVSLPAGVDEEKTEATYTEVCSKFLLRNQNNQNASRKKYH